MTAPRLHQTEIRERNKHQGECGRNPAHPRVDQAEGLQHHKDEEQHDEDAEADHHQDIEQATQTRLFFVAHLHRDNAFPCGGQACAQTRRVMAYEF